MIEIDLVSLLIGLLWGLAFVVVNHILGAERKYILILILIHITIVMAAIYTLLSVDGSVIAAGVITLLVLVLAKFTELPKNGSNQI
ncbi:hypothetical protein [Halosolutus gelatinilyticus]|uniref:hypothetical protein n=1 Tax=Halosolutus gelatinilyticus TaxID=2931975 RepID=UPI001FF5E9C7|nr:hypothetical protein [Halosolutus gelatinilyticus]